MAVLSADLGWFTTVTVLSELESRNIKMLSAGLVPGFLQREIRAQLNQFSQHVGK